MKLNSLGKSLQIVELLSKYPGGLSLSELTAKSGFPKSTIHHILSTFLPHEYIAQDPETKKYSLGFKFLNTSKSILDNIDIRKIAHNHLLQLHEECTETVHLIILRNGKVAYIDKIDKPGGLSLATYVGFYADRSAFCRWAESFTIRTPYEQNYGNLSRDFTKEIRQKYHYKIR